MWELAKRIYGFITDHLPDAWAVSIQHFRNFKKFPDFKNPQTFSEKIAWRKLYQKDPRFTLFADKVAVKPQIAQMVGESRLIETLWMGKNPDAIPFDSLQPPYVIKTSHGCGSNYFIRKQEDVAAQKDRLLQNLHRDLQHRHGHHGREWGYNDIPPMVFVERMLLDEKGDVPEDYKFFVYHGRVHFIQIDYARFTHHMRNVLDRDWNPLPVRYYYPLNPEPGEKPANHAELIAIAEEIGAPFDFARVDLYSLHSRVFFGEVTFYPDSGYGQFTPSEWNLKFGEPWNISKPAQD